MNIQSLSTGDQIEAGHFTITILSTVLCHFVCHPVTWNFKITLFLYNRQPGFRLGLILLVLKKCSDWSSGANKCAIIILQIRVNNY